MPVVTSPLQLLSTVQLEELTLEQRNIATFLRNHLKQNISAQLLHHIGGRAGTGKTVLLRFLHDIIVQHFGYNASCMLTATTGTAAESIGGRTLHSAMKLAIHDKDAFRPLIGRALEKLRNDLEGVKFLFIDEISLLSSRGLSELNSILQRALKSTLPFGGLSVFLFGDLLLLQPVSRAPVFEDLPANFLPRKNSISIDQSNLKKENLFDLFDIVFLEEMIRTETKEDDEILQKIRIGDITAELTCQIENKCSMRNIDIFEELKDIESENPGKTFMILATERRVVEALNDYKVKSMGTPTTIRSISFNRTKPNAVRMIKKVEGSFFTTMKVIVGCKMMLGVNWDQKKGLINGSIGKLKEINPDYLTVNFPKTGDEKFPRIGFEKNGQFWTDFPLRVAEVCTVHKAQGFTFDGVIITPGTRVLLPGLMYSALSRSRSLDLCRILHIDTENWRHSIRAKARLESKRGIKN